MARIRARRPYGFSLIEAMVASGILGIALIGLVRLHKSSMTGTAQAASIGQAAEVARQLAEMVASQSYESMANTTPNVYPHCPPGINAQLSAPPNPPPGCRASPSAFTIPKPDICTRWARGAELPSVDGADAGLGTSTDTFRIDMSVSQHPDPTTYPESILVTVWVCWRDNNEVGGTIREVSTSRIVTEGL